MVTGSAQAAKAPPLIESVGSRITKSSAISNFTPNPSQFPQAPEGLLKENRRGSISGKLVPQWAQAWCSEKSASADFPSAEATINNPRDSRRAVSTESANRSRPAADTVTDEDDAEVRTIGELRLDVAARIVHLGDREVELTKTEFDLLAALASRPGLAWSRRRLIEQVWGVDWVGDEHLVDVHIAHVRRKLGDDPASPRYVATVRGVGYRMGRG